MDFNFTCETDEGATYTPWTDGWAVGYKVSAPDKPDRYVVLNPSQNDDLAESNVFLYLDERPGDNENTVCFVSIWDEGVVGLGQSKEA